MANEEAKKEVSTEEQQNQVNPIEQDKESYAALEQLISDKKFTYVVACKQYGGNNVTSLVVNKDIKLSPQFKFFIQTTIIEVLNSISKDLINEFSTNSLVIGESANFYTREKLFDLVGHHLETLEKEGKIQIIATKEETVAKEASDEEEKSE
jgi:hypothetical protein